MAAAGGKSKLADAAARCRRHPSHRHAAGVCPFCLSDRLARLSAAGAGADQASASASASASSSAASSPRSSGEASSVSVAGPPPPCRREARRARLGLLMRQEETEALAAAVRHGQEKEAPAPEKKTKRGNFWTRLQQGSWYRKDGCSLAHSKAPGEKSSAPPKCAPLF